MKTLASFRLSQSRISWDTPLLATGNSLKYSLIQKICRGIFAGFIISSAVFLTKVLHPFWGGVFTCFPAVFTTTFIILHWYHGPTMIHKIVKTIPIGSTLYVIFALACIYTFPNYGIILGTISAYLISLIFFLLLYRKK